MTTPARPPIARTPTESSAFRSHGYDASRQVLALEFGSGGVHHLEGVSPELAAAFDAAPSKGKFFHEHLRGKFTTTRIDDDAPSDDAADQE